MSFTHPRRTTKTTSSSLTPTSSSVSGRPTVNTNMSLRKGATFHSPSSPERDIPHHFKVPALPRRSQTTLEDVVDAHKRRVALTLGDIDRGLSALEDQSPSTRQSFRDEADPVPQGILNVGSPTTQSYGPIMDSVMDKEAASIGRRSLRPRHDRRPSRYSDSGLGSSIGSSSGKKVADAALTSASDEKGAKSTVTASAITRSAAAHSSTIKSLPRLSSRASNRIQEHILKPLLAKSSLKDFHPIIKDCPRRIHAKEIVCLRDLEKTLIFMAPVSETHDDVVGGVAHWCSRLKERAKSAALYLEFCITSIRCIQATVEYLNDREQTRPHDRPYTNGYFVDLVDQIKQYAQQVQAAKEKEEKGEKAGDMDPESYVTPSHRAVSVESPPQPFSTLRITPSNLQQMTFADCLLHRSDEVRLHGGLTKNGRPAELVRVKKNGKAISIATGLPIDLDDEDSKEAIRFKRSLSEEAEEDESILRSMARRKRSASAAELAPKRCREPGCDKEFKRPCDLTKHEKTHSRPWKCPMDTCKYHEYGWPTEKEMDRHINDKHSSAPALYECQFKPCPYRSKRESNCKQHMEKAHGWEYVRSKNNGKNRDKATPATNTNTGLPTPQMTNIRTPSSNGDIVDTPQDDQEFNFGAPFTADYLFPQPSREMDVFGQEVDFQLEYSPISEMNNSGSSASHSPYTANTLPGQENFPNDFSHFNASGGNDVDFNLFEVEDDLYSANAQLPTPSHEIFTRVYETSGMPFVGESIQQAPHISPVGHGNTMLYTPTSLREVDEGFEDFIPQNNNNNLGNDFQLFPSNTGSSINSSAPSALFGEIPGCGDAITGMNFPLIHGTGQDLLNFYAATTAAVTGHNMNNVMDWSSDDQFGGYRSH